MRFESEAYELAFFKERGFARRLCKVCNEYFWTLDAEREVCGEAPCKPYSFIGAPPISHGYTLRGMREAFLGFFNKNGHEVIEPYPVVPRWRRDLYLVSASIVDFQPYVTSGIAEPPANPLVISQPCIRLVDIDKVGLTFGRHMTIFEMGGAHAFNFPGRSIYWKDETVAYCHEFLRSLGVREEGISYKESVWSGGGNAGPCFEVIVDGLEIATLVFMHYKTLDGRLEETPVKTVDTGYGIERLTWLSRGTPSSFEVVYEGLLSEVGGLLELPRIDEGLLRSYARYSVWIQPSYSRSVRESREVAARLAGIDLRGIEGELERLEKIYAALDFTKSIVFILAEGVVPSNAKVGYLARLLIRRAYRLLSSIGAQDKMLDLLGLQARYWATDFPKIAEMLDEVLELSETEIKRFRESVERGRQAVEREIAALKSAGKAISTEFFVRMYDEKGLTPDIVAEVASKLGVKAEVQENIYELVAALHSSEAQEERAADSIRGFERVAAGLGPTVKRYYERPFERSFEARVLRVGDGAVVLDQTLFYPEGGGQVGDTGVIIHSAGSCRVTDTQLVGDVVVHLVEGPLPREGEVVRGEIDYERRLSIMRHHTATHILIGAARRVLGKHAWQMGARKEADKSRLDVSHHKRLTRAEIDELERVANEVVRRRIPVSISWMDRNEAERRYGFYLYQGGEVPLGNIRVVSIDGWDAEACGGLHCENTEDVGLVKILRTERIQDGVERIIFAAGAAALTHFQESTLTLEDIASTLAAPAEMVGEKVRAVVDELRNLRRTVRRLASALASVKGELVSSKAEVVEGISLATSIEEVSDREYLISLAQSAVKRLGPAISVVVGSESGAVVTMANEQAIRYGVDAGRVAALFCEELGGKGGGKRDMGQGGVPSLVRLEGAIDAVRGYLRGLRRD